MKQIEVSAAIILNGEKILCVQRNENKYQYLSLKYEFPGGKLEPGESKENAVIREIHEELNLDINIIEEYLTVFHQYPDFKITMYSFLCNCTDISTLNLKEHIDYKWSDRAQLLNLDWAEADLPIVNKLIGLTI